jgi:hypothetical protein
MKHGLLLVSALVLAGGCEKDGKGSKVVDDVPVGEVRLVGAGVEPRAPLRYRVDKGTHVTMDMVARIGIDAGGMPVPQLPTMRMSMDETCTAVEPSGDMRFEVTVASFDVDGGNPQMAQAMDAVRDMMKNMVYRFRMSPSGKIDDVQVEGLTGPMAQIGNQMKQSIEQFAAPLPEEPVGKGSTWKFKRSGEANGVKMATVNEFELVDLQGDVATFKVKGRVIAPAQSINQGGVSAKLERMDGTVSGTIANDLRRFAPSGTFDMKLDMRMSAMGQTINMKMTMDSEISTH